ncbi:hypothetical protein FEM48_Zijuj03G0131000 [Ziziphus jujuba var. spinosa]|uniref:Dynamin N-terminal domain-containing protein n=1 Tax=Ziziphus jujuba var. spinosa TaxID=714518 RepID=A0A978VQG9_ZIZJJ|nr:hypothetical protein FEM48_Zijuj03G0131000 [Ziziphus jujuba var. spinosa]
MDERAKGSEMTWLLVFLPFNEAIEGLLAVVLSQKLRFLAVGTDSGVKQFPPKKEDLDLCFSFGWAEDGGVNREDAGKSAVLNSLIGHPVLPTGENGATRAPISIDLQRDCSLSSKLYKEWTLVGALTASGQGNYFQDPK